MKKGLLPLLVAAMAMFSFAKTPVESNGQLSVKNGKLYNEKKYPIQLRGMSTHGLQWYPEFINPTSMSALQKGWGCDIVRLSMYVHEEGYVTDPVKYTKLVDSLVEVVTAKGMYVIIDWHMLEPGNPMAEVEKAKTFFAYMSKKHKKKNNVFYEICNEPNPEGTEDIVDWSVVKQYSNIIIPIIRKNDAKNIIIVGTPQWCQRPDVVIGDSLPYSNLMYSVHFYAATQTREQCNSVLKAIIAKVPLFITECGTQEFSGDGENNFEASKAWFDILDSNRISWTNWNFSSDELTGAVFKVAPAKYDDSAYYNDTTGMKEAGVWIRNRMLNPADDFGPTGDSLVWIDTTHNRTVLDSFVTVDKHLASATSQDTNVTTNTWHIVRDSLVMKIDSVYKMKIKKSAVKTAVITDTIIASTIYSTNAYIPVADKEITNNIIGKMQWSSTIDELGSTEKFDSSETVKATYNMKTSNETTEEYVGGALTGVLPEPLGTDSKAIRLTYRSTKDFRITVVTADVTDYGTYGTLLPASNNQWVTVEYFLNNEVFTQPDWAEAREFHIEKSTDISFETGFEGSEGSLEIKAFEVEK